MHSDYKNPIDYGYTLINRINVLGSTSILHLCRRSPFQPCLIQQAETEKSRTEARSVQVFTLNFCESINGFWLQKSTILSGLFMSHIWVSLFCFSIYVSNFDLKFLEVILICVLNMHDFFSNFFAMFKFGFRPHVTWWHAKGVCHLISIRRRGGGSQPVLCWGTAVKSRLKTFVPVTPLMALVRENLYPDTELPLGPDSCIWPEQFTDAVKTLHVVFNAQSTDVSVNWRHCCFVWPVWPGLLAHEINHF
jgi:hypothetical protein